MAYLPKFKNKFKTFREIDENSWRGEELRGRLVEEMALSGNKEYGQK